MSHIKYALNIHSLHLFISVAIIVPNLDVQTSVFICCQSFNRQAKCHVSLALFSGSMFFVNLIRHSKAMIFQGRSESQSSGNQYTRPYNYLKWYHFKEVQGHYDFDLQPKEFLKMTASSHETSSTTKILSNILITK